MKVSHERLEGNQVELKVEVGVEKVTEAMDKAYKKVSKEVKIPGFRKGRVPRKILEARFGVEVLYNDALDFLLPEAYSEAIDEAGIEPIDRPEITEVHIEKDEPCTFTAVVAVKPEVTLGQYTDLGIEGEDVEITEEDVAKELEMLQSRHTQLKTTDREEVANGDFVMIDFKGYIDGEPFEGGEGKEYSLEIGSGSFIEGFEEQLIGTKVSDEVKVEVSFPEDYRAEHLAGKPATFEVTINEIKEKDIPALDDEFAKEASEFESLDELKNDIKNKLEENAKESAKRTLENKIVDAVAENSEIDIPEKMVEDQLDQMYQNMAMNLQQQGIPFDKYLEYTGSNVDQWREESKDEAEKQVRISLSLEAISEKEGISVSDEELDTKIAELAEKNNQDPKTFKQFLLLQGRLSDLSYGMTMEKVIDFLVEKNTK